MDIINYDILKNNLREFVYKIFNNYIKKYNVKDICGFCLYFHDSTMSFSIYINTYNNYREIQSSEDLSNFEKLDAKFNIKYWTEIIGNYDTLLNRHLKKRKFKQKQLTNVKNHICEISMESLEELKSSELFINAKKDFILLFLTEFNTPKMVFEGNKNYNSEKVIKEYDRWLEQAGINIQFEEWPTIVYGYENRLIEVRR